jgi:acetylornithine deacetylase/succinyl-diaminopimelate desuccinylase-like protein
MIVYIVEPQGPSKLNVMMYGHLDKQPWMLPWREGLGPTKAVVEGDWLYGRGGADDGYSPFSCMLAIANLQSQGLNHPRCALTLETEEESGSPNLLELLDLAKGAIGDPDIMICMDSGAFDYERLWITSSLRGITILDLTVECATQGIHSGEVGGVIPETFTIMRNLLDRIDNSANQEICEEMRVEVP